MMKEWSTKGLYILLVALGFGLGFGSMGFIYLLGFHWETDAWYIITMLPLTAGMAIVSSVLAVISLHELWTRTHEED